MQEDSTTVTSGQGRSSGRGKVEDYAGALVRSLSAGRGRGRGRTPKDGTKDVPNQTSVDAGAFLLFSCSFLLSPLRVPASGVACLVTPISVVVVVENDTGGAPWLSSTSCEWPIQSVRLWIEPMGRRRR